MLLLLPKAMCTFLMGLPSLLQEIEIMKMVDHPNIIQLYEVIYLNYSC